MSEMVPQHLAIIMDGNRRWAKERGKPSFEGHLAGYEKMKEVGGWALEKGIKFVTVYAFSTENWKRAADEVGYLMDLLEMALTKELPIFNEKGIRLKILGRREGLRESIVRAINRAEKETEQNKAGTLSLCLNYGGRIEIVDAVKRLVADGVPVDQIDEAAIQSRLYWPDLPDPDLVIRSSGEERLSNFLTWESAYSELHWCKSHWPAFSQEDFVEALETYVTRQRRYGK